MAKKNTHNQLDYSYLMLVANFSAEGIMYGTYKSGPWLGMQYGDTDTISWFALSTHKESSRLWLLLVVGWVGVGVGAGVGVGLGWVGGRCC